MASEWKHLNWGDIASLEYGKSLREYHEKIGQYRVFGTNGPIGWHYEPLCKHPGIIVGRKGAYRGIHYSPKPFFVIDTAFYLEPKQEMDMQWAYYCLLTYDINGMDSGSAIPSTNRESFYRLPVYVPPLNEQRAIAHILGTLDDKIELNRRMNETLEAMARAIFKSWFVDFDPVRAKAEGRDTGLPKHIADLFPNRFVDSELGEIPEGWEAGSFKSIGAQRNERVGTRKVVVLSAVASGKLARSDDHFTKQVYSKETNKYLLVEKWDFAYNPSRINIGSIGMLKEELFGGVSPVYVVIRPKVAYHWFLEFSLRQLQIKAWINTLASGSVRQSLSYDDFSSIPSAIPPIQLVEEFNRRWSVLRNGICSHQAESDTLAILRDTLLPKLISGELRLKDAEKYIGRKLV